MTKSKVQNIKNVLHINKMRRFIHFNINFKHATSGVTFPYKNTTLIDVVKNLPL